MTKIKKINQLLTYTVIFSLGFFLGLFVYRSILSTEPLGQYVSEEVTPTPEMTQKEIDSLEDFNTLSAQLPVNPTQASAVCGDGGAVIAPGNTTSCTNPVFTWNVGQSKSSTDTVIGYNVYWVMKTDDQDVLGLLPEHPLSSMQFGYNKTSNLVPVATTDTEFKPQDALQQGQTYYLLVQTVTNSRHPLLKQGGMIDPQNPQNIIPAQLLFTYIYQ